MRRLLPILACVLVLAACRADVIVDIQVAEDGSGVVTVDVVLDDELLAELPSPERLLRTDDLTAGGWTVERPAETGEPGTFRFTKAFPSPEALPGILAEIGGPGALVSSGPVVITAGESRRDYALDVQLDLTGTVDDLADPDLVQLLDGRPLGEERAVLEEQAGGPLEDQIGVTVRVHLPGESTPAETELSGRLSDATVTELPARSVVVDPEAVRLRQRAADRRDWATWALIGAAAWALLVAALWLALFVRRRRRAAVPAWVEEVTPGEVPLAVAGAESGRWRRENQAIFVDVVFGAHWPEAELRAVAPPDHEPVAIVLVAGVELRTQIDELVLGRAEDRTLRLRFRGTVQSEPAVAIDLETLLHPPD